MTTPGVVRTELRDGVGWVVIDNPDRRNALSMEMMRSLRDAVLTLDQDATVRILVLRGVGQRVFAAGADLSEMERRNDSAHTRQAYDDAADSLFEALASVAKPLVAMIHGYCFGAGVAVALAADIRFGDERTIIGVPAARMGIGYPLELTSRLVATVGAAHAAQILFAGESVDATEALRIGLLNRVVTSTELETVVSGFAATVASNAPLSISAAKLAIQATSEPALAGDARAAILIASSSEDASEGPRAFLEKRPPAFRGE